MPADLLSFSATRFDCPAIYDLAMEVAGAAMRLSNPKNAPEVKNIVKFSVSKFGRFQLTLDPEKFDSKSHRPRSGSGHR
jgi:hypothetical protein